MDLTAAPTELARFAIGGLAPRSVERPRTREALAEALARANRDGLAVAPVGGGTSLALLSAPGRYDLALDLGALDRIVEYDPEDLVVSAECGVTIATLRAAIEREGQELPLECAFADRATLGGVLATNACGARRFRFGAPRDRVLGAHFALGDGTLARTGGRVVKNVAGYAIHRLLAGSRGGLAVIVEASLKLMPAPEARAALLWTMDEAALVEPARWKPLARLEPSFLTVVGRELASGLAAAPAGAAGALVALGLEGDAAWTAEQERRAVDALGAPRAKLAGADVARLAQALADLERARDLALAFVTPDRSPASLAALPPAARAGALFHAAAGRLALGPDAVPDSAGFESAFAPAEGWPRTGAPAAIRAIRTRLREALDPGRRFALGDRWVGPPAD